MCVTAAVFAHCSMCSVGACSAKCGENERREKTSINEENRMPMARILESIERKCIPLQLEHTHKKPDGKSKKNHRKTTENN